MLYWLVLADIHVYRVNIPFKTPGHTGIIHREYPTSWEESFLSFLYPFIN